MTLAARTTTMRATATPSPIRNGKRRLLSSCAVAAGIMALSYGGPAQAQVAGAPLNLPGTVTLSTDTVGHSRSEEHTSELQSLMRISYDGFGLKKKKTSK